MQAADINESDRRIPTIAKPVSMLSFANRRPAKVAGAARTACPAAGDSAFKRSGCRRAVSGRAAGAAGRFAGTRANGSFQLDETRAEPNER